MTVKAYFLPSIRATQSQVSNPDLIFQAIHSLPEFRVGPFQALRLLTDYTQADPLGSGLECELLGIDCLSTDSARSKIYLPSRRTSFDSVRSIMTFGGRIQNPEAESVFRDLFDFWQALFLPGKHEPTMTSTELPQCSHRTAGILYYFDFSKTIRCPCRKFISQFVFTGSPII